MKKTVSIVCSILFFMSLSFSIGGCQKCEEKKQAEPLTKETGRDGRFIAYDNGTVLDTKTNLLWAAKDNGSDINWKAAKSYCDNYRGGGYINWRLPTLDELDGLYDAAKTYKIDCGDGDVDIAMTELIHLSCWEVWASEMRDSQAAFVMFSTKLGSGGSIWYGSPDDGYGIRVLPVRSIYNEGNLSKEKLESRPTEGPAAEENCKGLYEVYENCGDGTCSLDAMSMVFLRSFSYYGKDKRLNTGIFDKLCGVVCKTKKTISYQEFKKEACGY